MPFGTSAFGLIVETHEGRPTKVEGNAKHPANLGGTSVFMQAAILGLYDPDRSQNVRENGSEKTWADFVAFWQTLYPDLIGSKGSGLAILSDSSASPSLFAQRSDFLRFMPGSRWFSHEPVSSENMRTGVSAIAGEELLPQFAVEKAKVILTIDSDFLVTEPDSVLHARGFAGGRRVLSETDGMNRLYAVESAFTITGGMADHRVKLPAGQMMDFMIHLANALKQLNIDLNGISLPRGRDVIDQKWIEALAQDLLKNRGKSLIVVGRHLPAALHALNFAINNALDNTGKTIMYRKPRYEIYERAADIRSLVDDINNGKIEKLVILGGNPVYTAPADLNFAEALKKVKLTVHLSEFYDETSSQVAWHIPQTHFLEAWGDTQAADGTLGITQPMIAPLFDGKSGIELLNFLATGKQKTGYELVRETWRSILPSVDFEQKWREVLHDGLLLNSRIVRQIPKFNYSAINSLIIQELNTNISSPENTLEVVFRPSPAVYDGRYSNNGWLQELPDGVSKLTWDNAALISPSTAKKFDVKNEDVIVLEKDGRSLALPVWIVPGFAEDSATVYLGYGRTASGRIGNDVGFNGYRLRTSGEAGYARGVSLRKTIETYQLASTQDHGSMEGRPIVREATLKTYQEDPDFARKMVEHPPLESLWNEHSYDEGYQWGMTIDLNACTGCNACTIACQSENNIPIVGKEQVKKGREMHWLRMDRYFTGDIEQPEMVYQPVGCQHCENAPCEQVCPVAATVHDSEGLNVMTYNRCIGTRYCSNNCPYKVRRFNFFNYTNELPEIVKMVQNPDVTVRSRGVMEKCTYCVQRISEAKITAKKAGQILKDGEVKSACQQACPTNAIVFGNLNDPESEVVKMKKVERNYEMLAELNVKPRTSYLAKLRNPNPGIENS